MPSFDSPHLPGDGMNHFESIDIMSTNLSNMVKTCFACICEGPGISGCLGIRCLEVVEI